MAYKEVGRRRRGPRGCRRGGRRSEKWGTFWKLGHRERSRNGSFAWRHQNEQTHIERARATIPRIAPWTVDPDALPWTLVDIGAQR